MKSYERVKKRYVTQVTKWLHNFNITLLQHISNFITIKIKEAGREDTGAPPPLLWGEDPAFRAPGSGVPINSRPSVPGRLNLGGEIGGEMGGEIGGVGYGVFFAPVFRSRNEKHPQKHHYQTPPISPANP